MAGKQKADKETSDKSSRSSLWVWVARFSAVAGIFGVPLSVLIVVFAPSLNRSISIQFSEPRPLLASESASGQLELSYNDIEIVNPFTVWATIECDGTDSIPAIDIETPITFEFPSGYRIVGSRILDTSPRELRAGVSSNENQSVLDQGLMNPGDAISIELIVDGEPRLPEVFGRILGVDEIHTMTSSVKVKQFNAFLVEVPVLIEMVFLVCISLAVLISLAVWVFMLFNITKPKLENIYPIVKKILNHDEAFSLAISEIGGHNANLIADVFLVPMQGWLDSPEHLSLCLRDQCEIVPGLEDEDPDILADRIMMLARDHYHRVVFKRVINDSVLLNDTNLTGLVGEMAIGKEGLSSHDYKTKITDLVVECYKTAGKGKPETSEVAWQLIASIVFIAPFVLLIPVLINLYYWVL